MELARLASERVDGAVVVPVGGVVDQARPERVGDRADDVRDRGLRRRSGRRAAAAWAPIVAGDPRPRLRRCFGSLEGSPPLWGRRSFAKLISDANHLHDRSRPSPAPGDRPARAAHAPAGRWRPQPDPGRRAEHGRLPWAADPVRARRARADPAAHGHAGARAAGGGGAGRAHRRSRRPALEPRRDHARGRRPARVRARTARTPISPSGWSA